MLPSQAQQQQQDAAENRRSADASSRDDQRSNRSKSMTQAKDFTKILKYIDSHHNQKKGEEILLIEEDRDSASKFKYPAVLAKVTSPRIREQNTQRFVQPATESSLEHISHKYTSQIPTESHFTDQQIALDNQVESRLQRINKKNIEPKGMTSKGSHQMLPELAKSEERNTSLHEYGNSDLPILQSVRQHLDRGRNSNLNATLTVKTDQSPNPYATRSSRMQSFGQEIALNKLKKVDQLSQSIASPTSPNKRGRISRITTSGIPSNLSQVHPLPIIDSSRQSGLQMAQTPLIRESLKGGNKNTTKNKDGPILSGFEPTPKEKKTSRQPRYSNGDYESQVNVNTPSKKVKEKSAKEKKQLPTKSPREQYLMESDSNNGSQNGDVPVPDIPKKLIQLQSPASAKIPPQPMTTKTAVKISLPFNRIFEELEQESGQRVIEPVTNDSSVTSKKAKNDKTDVLDPAALAKSPRRQNSANKAIAISEPLPLFPRGQVREAEEDPKWKKRRLKHHQEVRKSKTKEDNEQSADKREMEEAMQDAKKAAAVKEENQAQLYEVQQKLIENGQNIKITSQTYISTTEYSNYFKYKIYECYKPTNLKQTREYLDYLTNSTEDDNQLSQDLYEYLSTEQETRIPNVFNQEKLLQFDSNFESGNLDSAYLVNEFSYNLLCKVDTNTKGNTYWFYFKTLRWKPLSTVTFNLLNVARDVSPFYDNGMNIMVRAETLDGRFKSPWICSKDIVQVVSFEANDIVRSAKKTKEYAVGKNYNTLKFNCTFPEIQNLHKYSHLPPEEQPQTDEKLETAPGTVFCFSYGLPYTYSDMVSDFVDYEKHLLNNGGSVQRKENFKDDKQGKPGPHQTPLIDQSTRKKLLKQNTMNLGSENLLQILGLQKADNKLYRNKSKELPEDRKAPTKQQLQSKELKNEAIKVLKDRISDFELKLLKAEVEQEAQIITQESKKGQEKLIEIQTDFLLYRKEVISQSVGGLNIYQLVLTKRKCPNSKPYHKRKCMYITARLHAAETAGSVIMQGILNELIRRPQRHEYILSNFIIKLIPMINTDGVTIGNSRSSLVGVDLNRRWAEPNRSIHPEIFFLKKIMLQQSETKQGIQIYCDLHGHNRKPNCFFYGCNKAADEGMLSWTKTRLLPKIFASVEQIFDYRSCRFKQDKFKLNTARVVVWNEMKVTNSFTLETSMYSKTVQRRLKKNKPPPVVEEQVKDKKPEDGEQAPDSPQCFDTELYHSKLMAKDLHQISRSYLISCSQYSKLEKELEKEFKLQYGWFKPQRLNEVTGEAVRDKQMREALQRKNTKKDRKQVTKRNSSTQDATNTLKKNKLNPASSHKVGSDVTSQNKKRATSTTSVLKHQQSLRIGKADKDDKDSIKESRLEVEKSQGKQRKPVRRNQHSDNSLNDRKSSQRLSQSRASKLVVTKVEKWSEFFDEDEINGGFEDMGKQPDDALTELTEEEGSDSEPSVDNLDQTELKEMLEAALDIKEGEKDPFAPIIEEKPEIVKPPEPVKPKVEENKKIEKIPTVSQTGKKMREKIKVELDRLAYNRQAEEEVKGPNQTESSRDIHFRVMSPPRINEKTSLNQILRTQLSQSSQRQVNQKAILGNRSHFYAHQQQVRANIMHQDLNNQLISQLIRQQTNQQTQLASAGPPSGMTNFNQVRQQGPNLVRDQGGLMTGRTQIRGVSLHNNQPGQFNTEENSLDRKHRRQQNRKNNKQSSMDANKSIVCTGTSSFSQPKRYQQVAPQYRENSQPGTNQQRRVIAMIKGQNPSTRQQLMLTGDQYNTERVMPGNGGSQDGGNNEFDHSRMEISQNITGTRQAQLNQNRISKYVTEQTKRYQEKESQQVKSPNYAEYAACKESMKSLKDQSEVDFVGSDSYSMRKQIPNTDTRVSRKHIDDDMHVRLSNEQPFQQSAVTSALASERMTQQAYQLAQQYDKQYMQRNSEPTKVQIGHNHPNRRLKTPKDIDFDNETRMNQTQKLGEELPANQHVFESKRGPNYAIRSMNASFDRQDSQQVREEIVDVVTSPMSNTKLKISILNPQNQQFDISINSTGNSQQKKRITGQGAQSIQFNSPRQQRVIQANSGKSSVKKKNTKHVIQDNFPMQAINSHKGDSFKLEIRGGASIFGTHLTVNEDSQGSSKKFTTSIKKRKVESKSRVHRLNSSEGGRQCSESSQRTTNKSSFMKQANGFIIYKQQMQQNSGGRQLTNYYQADDTSRDDQNSYIPESNITQSEDFSKTDMTQFMNSSGRLGGGGINVNLFKINDSLSKDMPITDDSYRLQESSAGFQRTSVGAGLHSGTSRKYVFSPIQQLESQSKTNETPQSFNTRHINLKNKPTRSPIPVISTKKDVVHLMTPDKHMPLVQNANIRVTSSSNKRKY